MAKLALAAMLKRKRVSKAEFARRLGIRYENVFRLFREGTDPRLSALTRYANALGCRVRDLIKE